MSHDLLLYYFFSPSRAEFLASAGCRERWYCKVDGAVREYNVASIFPKPPARWDDAVLLGHGVFDHAESQKSEGA